MQFSFGKIVKQLQFRDALWAIQAKKQTAEQYWKCIPDITPAPTFLDYVPTYIEELQKLQTCERCGSSQAESMQNISN